MAHITYSQIRINQDEYFFFDSSDNSQPIICHTISQALLPRDVPTNLKISLKIIAWFNPLPAGAAYIRVFIFY